MSEIQKSLFLVALDNPMPELNDSRMSMASKQFIHGGGSRGNSANRWFDKTVQVSACIVLYNLFQIFVVLK